MFRYEGAFNVVCRKRIDGSMSRVDMGTIRDNQHMRLGERDTIRTMGVEAILNNYRPHLQGYIIRRVGM